MGVSTSGPRRSEGTGTLKLEPKVYVTVDEQRWGEKTVSCQRNSMHGNPKAGEDRGCIGPPRSQVVTKERDSESTLAETEGLGRDADQEAISGFGVYIQGNLTCESYVFNM